LINWQATPPRRCRQTELGVLAAAGASIKPRVLVPREGAQPEVVQTTPAARGPAPSGLNGPRARGREDAPAFLARVSGWFRASRARRTQYWIELSFAIDDLTKLRIRLAPEVNRLRSSRKMLGIERPLSAQPQNVRMGDYTSTVRRAMTVATPDLTVRGEPVERVYGNFEEQRYVVNRRYQRKLIWTLSEKQNFIDSIIKGYPVPIILLAENAKRSGNSLEIIDGMQRLDAIVSFIGNRFAVDGHFFDLNTIAVTKASMDAGRLVQQAPIMQRDVCVKIASYLLPLSIYEFADDTSVDMVFRRINSGGRQLSRQELRSAGAVGNFATIVRRLSAKVRGDDSYSDVLRLNQMQAISITNRELDYGINVESLFWVQQGILSRDYIRQSRDEEIIADLVAYMVQDGPVSSRAEFLDDFYGMGDDKASAERYAEIETAAQKRSVDLVILDFQRTLDQIRITLELSGSSFVQLLFREPKPPVPRYFQVIFLAFYILIVRRNLVVTDRNILVEGLRGAGDHVTVQEGSNWGVDNRQKSIEAAVGILQKAFGPSTGVDPATVHWVTQLQNLLSQSYTEQAAYDFKQGFLLLDRSNAFDEDSFQKILKTCVAISNGGRGRKGYIIVGVVESDATASRIEQLFGISCLSYDRFKISGVEHEAKALDKTLDEFFRFIVSKIERSSISEPLLSYITSNLKSVRYYEKTIFVFEVIGQDQPTLYGDKYFERSGSSVKEIGPPDFPAFFSKYNAS
jgi:hypothetical protein